MIAKLSSPLKAYFDMADASIPKFQIGHAQWLSVAKAD
jgi:hypothetical protein